MTNRWTARLTAGTLAIVLGCSANLRAQTIGLPTTETARTDDTSVVVTSPRDPESRVRLVADWKIDDVNRVRWMDKELRTTPVAPQAKKQSHRGLVVMLIAIGGAVAGGYFGSVVQGSLCECDDQRTVGAAYGALIGGGIAGLTTYAVTR